VEVMVEVLVLVLVPVPSSLSSAQAQAQGLVQLLPSFFPFLYLWEQQPRSIPSSPLT
jgi:hypothetical protein